MNVLVACEYSGIVRDAFIARGHYAISCDLLSTDRPGPHYQGDVRNLLHAGWFDLLIAHPPCTDLAVSGSRWFPAKRESGQQQAAIDFFMLLARAPIKRKALENPVCIMSTVWRKPDQIIQPHQFGHPEFKATCLWLEGLAPLVPTNPLTPPTKADPEWKAWNYTHRLPPTEDRAKLRSATKQGIALAMAQQWG